MSKWIHYRAEKGMSLLEEHDQKLHEGKFSLLARATFPLVYGNPARKVFKTVLSTPYRKEKKSEAMISC